MSDAHTAIAAASARAGFQALEPAFLPTSANELSAVDAEPQKMGGSGPARYIELLYRDDIPTSAAASGPVGPLLVVIETRSKVERRGTVMSGSVNGFTVYKEILARSSDGTVRRVSYMAFKANLTIMMLFTGNTPSAEGFARMLSSFEPAS